MPVVSYEEQARHRAMQVRVRHGTIIAFVALAVFLGFAVGRHLDAQPEVARLVKSVELGDSIEDVLERCRSSEYRSITCYEHRGYIGVEPRDAWRWPLTWRGSVHTKDGRVVATLVRTHDDRTHAPEGAPADRKSP